RDRCACLTSQQNWRHRSDEGEDMRTRIAALAVAGCLGAATIIVVPANATPAPQPTERIYLAGRDPAGLVAYAHAVTEPNNPNYQHYLTPAQFQSRFGATQEQVTAITSWLT